MALKTITLAVALLSSSVAYAYQPNQSYHFTVLHTNDLHGHFWPNEQGEYGLAAQKTIIDQIRREVRAQGGTVLVLNAGDVNTGVPESDLQNARPDIEGMNAIRYDAMTLGNHEFDNPNQLLAMQERWAKFPFLSANVINKRTGKLFVSPYTMIQRGGLKFAIVGLTTEDTAFLSAPDYVKNVEFQPSQQAAKHILAEVNRQKPDVRIALTHLGYYHDGKHGNNAPGDVSLARNLPQKSFDMIIGGHSHTAVCINKDGSLNEAYQPTQPCQPDFQNGTWIMQAGEWGKYVGRADFEFKNGETKLLRYQLIPVNLKQKTKTADGKTEYVLYGEAIQPDAQLHAKLKTYQDKGDTLLGVKVGEVRGEFVGERDIVRTQQTNLGHFLAYVQMQKTQGDFAVINSGGIRDSLPEGEITYKNILKVQPFGNTLSSLTLTGAEVLDFLKVVAFKDKGSGGYPQFAGIRFTACAADKSISQVFIKDQALDLTKKYRISMPSYLASGGDGYPKLRTHPSFVDTGFIDADATKEYFMKHPSVDAASYATTGILTEQCNQP